jgi:hypothetical protein
MGKRRVILRIPPAYLRLATIQAEYFLDFLPISTYWLDYFALSRTTDIDAVSRQFGLLPARFVSKLEHLNSK